MPKNNPDRDPTLSDAENDANDQVESGDEQVLDELAVSPTPDVEANSDLLAESEAMPEELVGRAGSTSEDLSALFGNTSRQHLADGFVDNGEDDAESINQGDGDSDPPRVVHPPAA